MVPVWLRWPTTNDAPPIAWQEGTFTRMPTQSGYLSEIHCYFTDGTVAKFGQTDPDSLAHLIETIPNPNRLFAGRHLLIRAEDSVVAVRPDFVTRLDIISDNLPQWPYLHNATDIRQIWRGDIEERFAPERARAEREAAASAPGQPHTGFVSFHLVDQQTIYWEVTMPSQALLTSDIDRYLASILEAAGLHARMEGQGVMIINPANIAQVRFYPGPPELPARAWEMQTLLF